MAETSGERFGRIDTLVSVFRSQIIFSIIAMDDHIALAFEMRHFASDSFREVPGFLHCVLADNQFFRHDRPLLDDHLFFADGNPDGLSHGQFDQRADWLTRWDILRSQREAINNDFLALNRNGDRPFFSDDLFAYEDLTNLDGPGARREDLLTQRDGVKIMGNVSIVCSASVGSRKMPIASGFSVVAISYFL